MKDIKLHKLSFFTFLFFFLFLGGLLRFCFYLHKKKIQRRIFLLFKHYSFQLSRSVNYVFASYVSSWFYLREQAMHSWPEPGFSRPAKDWLDTD